MYWEKSRASTIVGRRDVRDVVELGFCGWQTLSETGEPSSMNWLINHLRAVSAVTECQRGGIT